MQICNKCGFENPDGVNFCENCGSSLKEKEQLKLEKKQKEAKPAKIKAEKTAKTQSSSKKISLKWPLMIAGILAVLFIAWMFIPRILSNGNNEDKKYFLRISGSNTIGQSLMPKLCVAYLKNKLNAKDIKQVKSGKYLLEISGTILKNNSEETISILIDARGSSFAFTQLDSNKTDIGMSSRRIKLNDIKDPVKAKAISGIGGEFEIGIDALVAAVNPNNSIQNVRLDDLASVYSGRSKNWQEIGYFSGANINSYTLDDHSGTFQLFKESVLDPSGLSIDTAFVKRFYSNDSIVNHIKSETGALGVMGYGAAQQLKMLSIRENENIIYPNIFNISLHEYPLVRNLFLYINPKTANPETKDFIMFCQNESEELIETEGFISRKIQEMPYDPTNKIAENASEEDRKIYDKISDQYQRLSLDILADASGNLFPESEKKSRELNAFISKNKSTYHQIMFVALDYAGVDKKNTDNAILQATELFKPYSLKIKSISLGNVVKPINRIAALAPVHIEIWLN